MPAFYRSELVIPDGGISGFIPAAGRLLAGSRRSCITAFSPDSSAALCLGGGSFTAPGLRRADSPQNLVLVATLTAAGGWKVLIDLQER